MQNRVKPVERNDVADKRILTETLLLEQQIDDAKLEVQQKQQRLLDLIR